MTEGEPLVLLSDPFGHVEAYARSGFVMLTARPRGDTSASGAILTADEAENIAESLMWLAVHARSQRGR